MKIYKRILRAGLICGLIVSAASCAISEEEAMDVGGLEVYGTVYDFESGKGVPGIRVRLSTYDAADLQYSYPLAVAETYSESDGSYIISTVLLSEHCYRLEAADVDHEANGQYGRPTIVNLNINLSGQGYDSATYTYSLKYELPVYPAETISE